MRDAIGLVAAGAVFGTLLDGVHVATSTTRYAHPAILGLSWWAPLLFAGASLAIGVSHRLVDSVLGRDPQPTTPRVVAGIVLLLLLWATSGLVQPPRLALFILAPASILMWLALDGSVVGLLLALATAAAGVAVEATLAAAGAFSYVAADAGRVASWLPWLYVAASVAVGNYARWLGGAPATRAPSSGSRTAR